MSVRAIQAKIICDRPTLESLWRTHRVFNERLPSILSVLFAMRRGKLGDSPDQQHHVQAFVWGVLQQEAQNAYDPLIKAANGSKRDTTARNALKRMAGKAQAAIQTESLKPAEQRDQAKIEDARKTLDQCRLYAASFDLFRSGWLPLRPVMECLADLPNTLQRKLFEEACAHIRGHLALVEQWHTDHRAWLNQKAQWEADSEHRQYLALRPRFEGFEQAAGGELTKRRQRWHLYLDWLRGNPDLAGWRGGPAVVKNLEEQAIRRIARAKPWKKRSVEAEEFWNVNPELKDLDRLHGQYESRFVRRRKRKRNPDGFDHRPTFTLPHPVRHPRWLVFNAPQTSPQGYRALALPVKLGEPGSIELRLLTGETGAADYPEGWVRLRFKADPRLVDFRPVTVQRIVTKGKIKGQLTHGDAFEFFDRHLDILREATISGAKLIFRDIRLNADGSLHSAIPYLVFACTLKSIPATEKAKEIQWSETGEVTRTGKKRKRKTLPEGLVTCAVDLGYRHLGFATLAIGEGGQPRVLRSRNIWIGEEQKDRRHSGRWSAGPDLAHLGRHKRDLRRLRRLRGKPVKGEASHVKLQGHIDHMAEDRFKRAARAIITMALNTDNVVDKKTAQPFPRADVLILESLANLIPDGERERGINRMLVEFNRGHLVDRVREMAADVGLKVFEVSPVGTSQICCHCGALGRRYSIRKDSQTHKPAIHFGMVEKLFACPECGYRANSDHNASVNLHRRFYSDDAVRSYILFRQLSIEEQRAQLAEIEEKLQPLEGTESLAPTHCLDGTR